MHRVRFCFELLAVGLVLAGIVWTVIGTLHLLPPRTVTMVTGPQGGAYHKIGERYRKFLAREGFNLRLLPTAGTVENLIKLNDTNSAVSIGLLQGGIASEQDSPNLVSLGAVFYEPLWLFYRGIPSAGGIESLRGRRISIGSEGSGTRSLALELLARNQMTNFLAELLPLTPEESKEELLSERIDAALVLASYESPVVQQLLVSPNIEIADFPRADTYVALYPFLSKVVVPAGLADLANNRPPTSRVLLAPKASLVVRKELHPAIQYLLLQAAEQIHSPPGVFQTAGQFPEGESDGLPLSEQAQQFYHSGEPFLQRHLPVWLAVLISRLLFFLIPVVGILYPLFRVVPALYGWKMRRRVYKLYDQLRDIEHRWETQDARGIESELISQINRLEEKADRLWVPVSSMGILYLFKEHIVQVRQRLGGRADRREERERIGPDLSQQPPRADATQT